MSDDVKRAFEEVLEATGGSRGALIGELEALVLNGEAGATDDEMLLISNLLLQISPEGEEEAAMVKDLSLEAAQMFTISMQKVMMGGSMEELERLGRPVITNLLRSLASISRRRALGIANEEEERFITDCRAIRTTPESIILHSTDPSAIIGMATRAHASLPSSCTVFDRLAMVIARCMCSCIGAVNADPTQLLNLPRMEATLNLCDSLIIFAANMETVDEEHTAGLEPQDLADHVGDACTVGGVDADIVIHPVTGRPALRARLRCREDGCGTMGDPVFLGWTRDGWTQVRDENDVFLADLRIDDYVCEDHREVIERGHGTMEEALSAIKERGLNPADLSPLGGDFKARVDAIFEGTGLKANVFSDGAIPEGSADEILQRLTELRDKALKDIEEGGRPFGMEIVDTSTTPDAPATPADDGSVMLPNAPLSVHDVHVLLGVPESTVWSAIHFHGTLDAPPW